MKKPKLPNVMLKRSRKLTDADRLEIKRLYIKEKRNGYQIAAIFNVSAVTVYNWIKGEKYVKNLHIKNAERIRKRLDNDPIFRKRFLAMNLKNERYGRSVVPHLWKEYDKEKNAKRTT